MATLRPDSGASKSTPLPSSPNTASLSPSPISGHTSPGSPSTNATSVAPATIPSDEEVEAVIKQATSTLPIPDGRPPPGKDTRTQLFTGNLPYRVRWQDLKDLFRRAGTVLRADVSLTPDNRSRGYGTVLLASAEDAGRAVDMFNGYNWQGRVLEVRLDRLGNIPGADLDANVGGVGPGISVAALPTVSAMNGLASNLAPLNGLHVPSPHTALPYATQQLSSNAPNMKSSPALLSATSSLAAVLPNASQTAGVSPLGSLDANVIALQRQQQQFQQVQREREAEELLRNQGAPGRPGTGRLDPFLSTLNPFGGDLDRDQSRSTLGMRSLFVGNLPFHCQWQDLKDLFRQAGTIVRADVSLGPDGRSRGFGTVTFANEIDAERAVVTFNGFDYNGRILKVHYDKFSVPSPLPPPLSPRSSNLTTPVQPAAVSTQAALLQAAQLQQFMGGQTFDCLSNLGSWGADINGNNPHKADEFTAQTQTQNLGNALQALYEAFPVQSQSRPTTSSDIGNEQPRPRVKSTTSETSVSPLSVHLPGTSPSLAERRQKVPPPIGTVSTSTSRRPSAADTSSSANLEATATLSTGVAGGNLLSKSPASSANDRRPVSQSLPASSASAPLAKSAGSPNVETKRAATTSTVPTSNSAGEPASSLNPLLMEPSISDQPSRSTPANPTSPRSSHPAHPGPISLPPPLPVSSFPACSPQHHSMSPPGNPMSPSMYASYPSYGPMSPMHSYPLPSYMHPANMTPHGLPPITPSMPSFSFAPPQVSPNISIGGSSAIPPTPADGTAHLPEGYLHSSQPGDSHGRGMSMMPMMSPPMPLPQHVFQPFTPGTVMSPGSPVHNYPPYGYPHPGSQPSSPYYYQGLNGGQHVEEPSGYFPPVGPQYSLQPPRHEGYFPPVSSLGNSGLANEILRAGSSMNMEHGSDSSDRPPHERNDSGSAPASSENGPGEETDAERARSTSSGATSWRSCDERASGSAKAGTDANKAFALESLAQDMASIHLGSRTKAYTSKRGDVSYAAAAANDTKRNAQRTESADGGAGCPPAARHNSTGSEGTRKPPVLQKTHSDETAGHVRLSVEDNVTS